METLTNLSETAIDRSFNRLQERFKDHFQDYYNDSAEKTIVIVPSLSLDTEMLKLIKGTIHYEERLLCLLMLLRMPRTKVIYVTSVPIDSWIIDYYLHLLPGIPASHAKQRLTMLSCYDASRKTLTEKILARPRLIRRIKEQINMPEMTHMACFNVTEQEKELAVKLNIPIFGCDPKLLHFGTKSGSREIFKEVGALLPDGVENLKDEDDVCSALAKLKKQYPEMKKAVVKMNDGFSGEGNGIFYYRDIDPNAPHLESIIKRSLPRQLKIVAENVTYEDFIDKFHSLGGIVEIFVDGEIKESPSVQCRIKPDGETEIISTHDQVLGGEGNQEFLGASFPAQKQYSRDLGVIGRKIAETLRQKGVLGRFAIDFISVLEADGWKHYAIEINLRKGGTSHPYLMLEFLTGGYYHADEGVYRTPNGDQRCYFSSDNVINEKYVGLSPQDLIDIATCNGVQFNNLTQTGVMFHMIGALSQYGKVGMVCIGRTVQEAKELYERSIAVLDQECKAATDPCM